MRGVRVFTLWVGDHTVLPGEGNAVSGAKKVLHKVSGHQFLNSESKCETRDAGRIADVNSSFQEKYSLATSEKELQVLSAKRINVAMTT